MSKQLLWILIIAVVVVIGGGVMLWYNQTNSQLPMETVSQQTENSIEKISYQTKDGVEIVGNYWRGSTDKGIILLHMMPAVKESWNEFAEALNKALGWHVLAIDLRGHGESGGGNYQEFNDQQHQASIEDLEAGRRWLAEKGVLIENLYVGGASIGANLAIRYWADHPDAPGGFVLSPGLDYRGIKTDEEMLKTKENQRIYLIAAEDDKYSADSVRQLTKLGPARKLVTIFPQGGHGTTLFKTQKGLSAQIINWLMEK